jgi:hypothetical protein
MKKNLFILCYLFTFYGFSQIEKGTISFDIKYKALNEDQESIADMFTSSSMTVSFQGKKVHLAMELGSLFDMKLVSNPEEDRLKMLMTYSGGNEIGVDCKISEIETKYQPIYDVEKTNEKKKVLGFNCIKYIGIDNNDNEFVLWATDEIKVYSEGNSSINQFNIDSYPLDYTIKQEGFEVRYLATKFSKSTAKKVFDLKIPKNVQILSVEEINDANEAKSKQKKEENSLNKEENEENFEEEFEEESEE